MSVESLDGPVTANEINSFVNYIQTISPVVWPNTGSMENQYAQGSSGEQIKGMGLIYEISGNIEVLNRMIYFCDTLLSQRNDLLPAPNGQRVYWNGKISPAWPGQALGTASVYSTSASGDCVGHLANCARLILQTPALWSTAIPDGNPYGYGATYLDRAKTYVAQADYTFSNCFFPDMLTLTNSGLTNIYCYPLGSPYQPGNQYPWNQAMMMNYPLQNLAIAHSVLGDNPTLAAQYDLLVQTNVGRFFSDPAVRKLVTDQVGKTAYDWAYNPAASGGEDSNHGALDVAGFYRAYATGRYGITPAQMTPFANTIADIMTLTIGSYYAGTVEGCTTCTGHAGTTTYLRSGYFFTAEFRPDQYYNMVQGLRITAPGTTGSTDAFSRFMWIKHRRYLAANAFYVSASPATSSPIAGTSATYAVKVTPSSTFSGTVALSANGLPPGVTAAFSSPAVDTSGITTLSVSTSITTTPGTYWLTITGTSGSAAQTATVALVVGSPQISAPTFSPLGGTYSTAQNVAITTTSAGATLRYTTDGSTPTATTGSVYSVPVAISATTTLKAMAYAPSMIDSPVASATYTIQAVAPFTLSASAVTASTYTSSYVPANTVDGSLATRWAGKGDGVWITYDLGAINTVNYVNIAWYQGTTRVYTFDLQVSSDASTWTTLLTGQTTSGATNSLETYHFTATNGRYVRVVGHKNTTDTYINITEIQIWGGAPSSITSVTSNPAATYSTAEQTVPVTASVTPSIGVLNSGTVVFTVLDGTTSVGSPVEGAVANGVATATYLIPASQHAGSYTIQAVFGGASPFAGSSASNGALTINKATPIIRWATPADIFYGVALGEDQLNATADISGSFNYAPDDGAVLPAGDQTLAVTFLPSDTTDYTSAMATVQLRVNRAAPALAWATPGEITYGTVLGAAQLNATADISGGFTYAPVVGTLLNAGPAQTLTATFAPDDTANYQGATISTLITVRPVNASITVSGYTGVYDGAAHHAAGSATGVMGESLTNLLSVGSVFTNVPGGTATWSFAGNANYLPATGTVAIQLAKAPATIALTPLSQPYDGSPRIVTPTTTPAGLAATMSYRGSITPPILPGSYAVAAAVEDPNYAGAASDTLVVGITALVRHAPTLNGDVDGSIQFLLGEGVTLNGSAGVSGDLLVPGLPVLRANGQPTYAGVKEADGAMTPTGYTVTLNGGSLLRYLVRRVDSIAMPVVTAPAVSMGTRDVAINHASQTVGDFATVRDLTLNGNTGLVSVPPGTYRNLTTNGGSGFVLGVAGATTPASYNLQNLTVNGNAQIQLVGPVVLVLANGVRFNGNVGAGTHPEWLELRVANGDVTLNGGVALYGTVVAPMGRVTLNGNSILEGSVVADRLTINGNGLLTDPDPGL